MSNTVKWVPLAINRQLTAEEMARLGLEANAAKDSTLTDDQADALEKFIYDAQEVLIKEKYGQEAAEFANYGWAVEVSGDKVGVATKVYVNPRALLFSDATLYGEMVHVWDQDD